MNITQVKELIQRELPNILKTDDTFRYVLQDILRESYADKRKTEDHFDQILAEIREEREKNQAEMRILREESERRWIESNAKWDAKWDKQQSEMRALREETLLFIRKYNSSIGALGARWGLQSESSFRNALKNILEESFGVKVLNINDFDHEGTVFGRPDQVELDIIIKNGLVIVCEIKSSISKSDMYIFERKVRFYEKQYKKTVNRLIVISPMVDKYAYPVAENLGIEVYSYAEDVNVN